CAVRKLLRHRSATVTPLPPSKWCLEESMKTVVAVLIGIVFTMTAYPAAAHLVAVTTSIPAQRVANDDDLAVALKSAIDDVVQHVVAFSPTFVSVESARAVGGRIYILLIIGDDDGAATLKVLSESTKTTSF